MTRVISSPPPTPRKRKSTLSLSGKQVKKLQQRSFEMQLLCALSVVYDSFRTKVFNNVAINPTRFYVKVQQSKRIKSWMVTHKVRELKVDYVALSNGYFEYWISI